MAVCGGRFDALLALLEEEMPRQQLDQDWLLKYCISGPIETLPELMAVCEGRFDALIALLEEEMPRQQLDQVGY